jgi:hypothetical protein
MLRCAGFEAMLDAAGSRGLSVIATEEFGDRGFRLQARACDAAAIPAVVKWLSSERRGESNIALVAQTGIRYCPSCGADLEKLINYWPKEFAALLEKHRQFALRVTDSLVGA